MNDINLSARLMPTLSEEERKTLVNIANVRNRPEAYRHYESVVSWLETFVASENSAMRRPGAVCPYMPALLRSNVINLITLRTSSASSKEAVDCGFRLLGLYRELFGVPPYNTMDTILGVFPGITDIQAPDFIDEGHRQLKATFVRNGLMIGEFHPASSVVSVRNSSLRVMRAPIPMFAVRALTKHDVLFLSDGVRQGVVSEAFRESYVKFVANITSGS